MRTSKAISTISFNTPSFLSVKLQELQASGIISFFAFILHKAEDDEAGLKDHLHLYIEPSKVVQTDDLLQEFKEFDPLKPDKPRGCILFRSSKFDPWFMYVLHDPAYLVQKGQSRRFHYTTDEIICSDSDDLLYRIRSIDQLSLSPYRVMLDAINQGLSFDEFFARGTVPIQQLLAYQKAWALLASRKTSRNGRAGHEMTI